VSLLDASRYPLSPEAELMREFAEKLRGEEPKALRR
jgi:hypothetical protein